MSSVVFDNLKQIAQALAAQFGDQCEVVIHDLESKDIEKSIVYIENGGVSGRKVGDGPSQIVLDAFAKKDSPLPDHLAYLLRADNGNILKSSTVFIRDESGKIRYIFAINFNITSLMPLS